MPRITGAIMTTYGGKNYSNHQGVSNGSVIPVNEGQAPAVEPFMFQPAIARNGRGKPSAICPTLTSGGLGDTFPHVSTYSNRQGTSFKDCHRPSLQARAGTNGGNLPLVSTFAHWPQDGRVSKCNRPSLLSRSPNLPLVSNQQQVRRLTPRECERLQGFPDDYTRIPYRGKPADKCPDGPRYKALGNSWAVPVVQWIGQRILEVDALKEVVVNLPAE